MLLDLKAQRPWRHLAQEENIIIYIIYKKYGKTKKLLNSVEKINPGIKMI